jgi:hypothetical protein
MLHNVLSASNIPVDCLTPIFMVEERLEDAYNEKVLKEHEYTHKNKNHIYDL